MKGDAWEIVKWMNFFVSFFLVLTGIVLYQIVVGSRCPNCRASWRLRRTLNKETFETRGLIFKIPSKVRYSYQCSECNYQWTADQYVYEKIFYRQNFVCWYKLALLCLVNGYTSKKFLLPPLAILPDGVG